MTPQWKNELVEAWVLPTGSLIVRRRVNQPKDGHDHYFMIDCLNKVEEKEAA